MPRRPTQAQVRVMENIRLGRSVLGDGPTHHVGTFESSMLDGVVHCHRTIRTPDRPTGRTELFRIQPDGTVSQH